MGAGPTGGLWETRVYAGPFAPGEQDPADTLLVVEESDDPGVLAVGGDLDGDGIDDLLVGIRAASDAGVDAGAVAILYGPVARGDSIRETPDRLTGEFSNAEAGTGVAYAGDLGGDGRDDLLVAAAPWRDNGAVYVVTGPVYGTVSLSDAHAEIRGTARDTWFGGRFAPAGDVDGDDEDDLLIGAPYDDTIAEEAGAVYLYLGGGG